MVPYLCISGLLLVVVIGAYLWGRQVEEKVIEAKSQKKEKEFIEKINDEQQKITDKYTKVRTRLGLMLVRHDPKDRQAAKTSQTAKDHPGYNED